MNNCFIEFVVRTKFYKLFSPLVPISPNTFTINLPDLCPYLWVGNICLYWTPHVMRCWKNLMEKEVFLLLVINISLNCFVTTCMAEIFFFCVSDSCFLSVMLLTTKNGSYFVDRKFGFRLISHPFYSSSLGI